MSLLDPYYDHHPTHRLERPLALTGFFGAGVVEVAASLSQRTGLPVIDLDRWIEHDRGCGLSALVLREGEASLRDAERRLLRRAVAARPASILALGDGALMDPESLALVLRETDLVYLREDISALHGRLVAELDRGRTSLYPFVFWTPAEPEDLVPTFEARRLSYEAAEDVIDLGGAPGRAVGPLMARLKRG
jgi:shikimate kinase